MTEMSRKIYKDVDTIERTGSDKPDLPPQPPQPEIPPPQMPPQPPQPDPLMSAMGKMLVAGLNREVGFEARIIELERQIAVLQAK
jgi:hypothetical protein